MREIETLLSIDDLTRIFGLSRVSVYRKVAAAKAGEAQFPVPINGDRQRLRWDASAVEAYIKSKTAPKRQIQIVSPAKQKKQLKSHSEFTSIGKARHGIVINKSNKTGGR